MNILRGLFFFIIGSTQIAVAQHSAVVYENKVYQSHIKTVQCYHKEKEQSLPLILLHSQEQLLFSFDDLRGGSKNYRYEVEHCRADWTSSGLSALDFVSNFAGDRLQDYQYSSGTSQKYSHYTLALPNEQVRFKISGNYILKIYEDNGTKTPVITQRFFVSSNLMSIKAQVSSSPVIAQRHTHQKVNFSVSTNQVNVQQVERELKTVVMQNANPGVTSVNAAPSFVGPGIIQYNDPLSTIFKGGNEFRRLDLRALQNKTIQVIDLSRNKQRYSSQMDENGKFFIRNLEDRDPAIENDYILVDFNLSTALPDTAGTLYIMGGLNRYTSNEDYKLTYDHPASSFRGSILLKQGLYDYTYVWKSQTEKGYDDTRFEGTYFETGNSYQILIYYKKPGNRWEELVGYLSIQTDTLPAMQ